MSGWRNLRHTLTEPNFRVFTLGNISSLLGTWIQRVTIGWVTWELTQSGTWLGIVAFADLFPIVLVAPIAGAYADRVDRLNLTKISQALLMLQAGALFALALADLLTIAPLVALTLFGGIVTGFNQPARLALLPDLVDRSRISTAVAVNSIAFNTARFLGPAMAGLLLVGGGAAWAFLINFVTFGAFLLALMRIHLTQPEVLALESQPFFPSVLAGWHYVRGHAGLAAVLLMAMITSLLVRPILELLPSYADQFGLGVGGFATFTSVIGIGALAAGIWLAVGGTAKLLGHLVFGSGFLLSAALLATALSPNPGISLIALAVLGFGLVVSGVASQSILQLVAEAGMRGRVLSLHGLIFRGAPALGALAMGSVVDVTGLTVPLVVAAILTLAFTCSLWTRRERLQASLGL